MSTASVRPLWRDDELVKVREAAEWLGWDVSTYYKKVKRNAAPKPIKFGRTSRVLASELKAMVESAIAARSNVAA